MNKTSLYIILISFSYLGVAQISNKEATVKIIDSTSKLPLFGVHVYPKNFKSRGGVTNELGECTIAPQYSPYIISYVGYKKLEVKISNMDKVLYLERETLKLEEVIVTPFNVADTLLKALKLIPINHNQTIIHEGIYRNLNFKNDTLKRMAEAKIVYQVDRKGRKKVAVRKVNKSTDLLEYKIEASPYSLISKNLENLPFFEVENYDFSYNGILKNSNSYEIEFKPKTAIIAKLKTLDEGTIYLHEGTIYLDITTLSFKKINISFHREHLKYKILKYKYANEEVSIYTEYASATLIFSKKGEKSILLSRSDFVLDKRVYNPSGIVNHHISYSSLLIDKVSENYKIKNKNVLDKKASIYSIDKGKNIGNQQMPSFIVPQLISSSKVKTLLQTIQEFNNKVDEN